MSISPKNAAGTALRIVPKLKASGSSMTKKKKKNKQLSDDKNVGDGA